MVHIWEVYWYELALWRFNKLSSFLLKKHWQFLGKIFSHHWQCQWKCINSFGRNCPVSIFTHYSTWSRHHWIASSYLTVEQTKLSLSTGQWRGIYTEVVSNNFRHERKPNEYTLRIQCKSTMKKCIQENMKQKIWWIPGRKVRNPNAKRP